MLALRWPQKPPIGTPFDRSHWSANGLVWSVPFWDGSGSSATEVASGNGISIASSGSPLWGVGSSSLFGSGISLVSSTQFMATSQSPLLQVQRPLTMVIGYRCLGAFASNAFIYTLNCSGSNPFLTASISAVSTTAINLSYGHAASLATTSAMFTPVVGVDYVLVAVFGTTTAAIYAFSAAAAPVVATATLTAGAVTYTAPSVGLGNSGRATNGRIYFADLYSRAWTYQDALAYSLNVWQRYRSPASLIAATQAVSGNLSMTAAEGSFALTGEAATLRAARLIAAQQGVFTETGEPVTFSPPPPQHGKKWYPGLHSRYRRRGRR